MTLESQPSRKINTPFATQPVTRWQISPPAEALLAMVIAALVYYALQGQLPYHDAQRFTNQVSGGVFVWDIGHILLQPTAMLLHQWSGADPVTTLKMLSSLSTAAAVGLFHLLLLRLDLPRWQAVLGTLILAGCCSVLTLAPSAHPKLAAFPFVNGAFLCLCISERRGTRSTSLLVLGGVLLALGAGFLASVLATAPFVALAILFAARRDGADWGVALGRAAITGGACGLVFLIIVCAGYVLLTGNGLSWAGLIGSVGGKADLRPAPIPLAVHLARVVFGTVNNLVAVPGLGATAQAWMRGQIPSLRPYAGLLPILALWLMTGLLVAAIYLRAAIALLHRRPCFIPVAFLCGAQTWTIWYGLNDPEHWFQLTAPTIVLFLTTMPAIAIRAILPAWAAIATAANFALLAAPVAAYPLAANEAKLAQMLGPKDLLVLFVSYPGRPHAGFFAMPGVKTLPVDLRLRESGAPVDSVLQGINAELQQTLQGGGRVLVADMLDPYDWEAPWMALLGQGVTKKRLEQALLDSRSAQRLENVGGIKLWELRPFHTAAVQR
jgi:hypothetical protein